METINKFIETLDPKIIEIITMLFTTVTGYIILGIIVLLLLMIIKYHELVEGTKCYSVFLPIPLIREYFIIKLTSGKPFAWLYVMLFISASIASLLPIKNTKFNNGLEILIKGLIVFLLLNIVIGFFKFIILWIKEKIVNKKYKKLEKEDKIKKQQEEEKIRQQELLQQQILLNNTQNINNNQQPIQQTQHNNYTPMYTEELSFKPNNNTQITNAQTNYINNTNQSNNYQQQPNQQNINQQQYNNNSNNQQ